LKSKCTTAAALTDEGCFRVTHLAALLVGALLSAAIVFGLRLIHPLNGYAYAPIGLIACVGIGCLISFALPSAPRSLNNLTIRALGQNT